MKLHVFIVPVTYFEYHHLARLDDQRRREAVMHQQPPEAHEKITFERDYPGEPSQARQVRADLAEIAGHCPFADELTLLASELAANAITHSKSGESGGTFTVRAWLSPGDYAWVEVTDHGGQWTEPKPGTEPNPDDEHGRGLAIVAAIAGDGNWGINGDTTYRLAWFRLNWHHDHDHDPARIPSPITEAHPMPETLPTFERTHLERLKLAADVLLSEHDALTGPLESELTIFRDRVEHALLQPGQPGE
jgi:anti-sigma regulatory factor (Ser/Thr protein kinase)